MEQQVNTQQARAVSVEQYKQEMLEQARRRTLPEPPKQPTPKQEAAPVHKEEPRAEKAKAKEEVKAVEEKVEEKAAQVLVAAEETGAEVLEEAEPVINLKPLAEFAIKSGLASAGMAIASKGIELGAEAIEAKIEKKIAEKKAEKEAARQQAQEKAAKPQPEPEPDAAAAAALIDINVSHKKIVNVNPPPPPPIPKPPIVIPVQPVPVPVPVPAPVQVPVPVPVPVPAPAPAPKPEPIPVPQPATPPAAATCPIHGSRPQRCYCRNCRRRYMCAAAQRYSSAPAPQAAQAAAEAHAPEDDWLYKPAQSHAVEEAPEEEAVAVVGLAAEAGSDSEKIELQSTDYDSLDDFLTRNPAQGKLTVYVLTPAQGTPVQGAQVRVTKEIAGAPYLFAEGATDASGKAGPFALPTPAKQNSFAPPQGAQPYSLYTVEVTRAGDAPQQLQNITMFAETDSVQVVRLGSAPHVTDEAVYTI